MTAAEVRAGVIASRRAQGLPDHITDRSLLDQLARAILAAPAGGGHSGP